MHGDSNAPSPLLCELVTATNAAKFINDAAATSVDESHFRCRSITFESTIKQMSSMTVQEYIENEDRHLLSHMPAVVFSDSKRCSRLTLFRGCVMSVKK